MPKKTSLKTKKSTLRTTWDLSPLFKSDTDTQIAISEQVAIDATKQFAARWRKNNDYLKKPVVLLQALKEFEVWLRDFGANTNVMAYFGLRLAQEQGNPKLKAAANKASQVAEELSCEMKFFGLSLSRIPVAYQKKFLKAKILSPYHNFLRVLFSETPHLLSEQEEKILTLVSRPSYDKWVEMNEDLLSREERLVLGSDGKKRVKASIPLLSELISHPLAKVRREAAEAMNDILAKQVPVAEAEINAVLAYKEIVDKLKKYERPEDGRLLSDDIDRATVEALVQATVVHYPLVHRFYYLKSKLLGLSQIAYPERNLPVGKLNIKHSFSESHDFVRKAFVRLDPEFVEIFDQLMSSGAVDVFPKKGRSGGAFCSASSISTPVYILLNHTGSIHDTVTFGHEAGHAIHFRLSQAALADQPINFGASTVTAETASTLVEDFVLEEVAKGLDDKGKFTLLMQKLNDSFSTISRQIAAYCFEQELHQTFRKSGYVSEKEIGIIFKKHLGRYLGPAVKLTPGTENWWVYWSHFRNFFYVYSYAAGLLVSKAVQQRVRANPASIKAVKDFLRAGESASPRELFGRLGFDIADHHFWEIGFDELSKDLQQAEKLAKKLGLLKKKR